MRREHWKVSLLCFVIVNIFQMAKRLYIHFYNGWNTDLLDTVNEMLLLLRMY